MSMQAGARLKNSKYGRIVAPIIYLLLLFSGTISFIWNSVRLVELFDPSTYSPSLPIWKIIVVPLIALSVASLILTYILQQQIENRFQTLRIGIVVLAVLSILLLWLLNLGLDPLLGPLSWG